MAAAAAVWAAAALRLSVIDLRTRTLPSRIIWAAAAVVWVLYSAAALAAADPALLANAAAGAAACAAPLAVIHIAHRPSMGLGDVRFSVLNGMLCGWWGWQAAVAALAGAFCLALPEALWAMARHGPRTARALGPYLAVGAGATAAWSAAMSGLVPGA